MMSRVFANGLGDLGSIPGRVIPKTQKMVLDTSLLQITFYYVSNFTYIYRSMAVLHLSNLKYITKGNIYIYIYIYIYIPKLSLKFQCFHTPYRNSHTYIHLFMFLFLKHTHTHYIHIYTHMYLERETNMSFYLSVNVDEMKRK